MRIPAAALTHTIIVEPSLGNRGDGDRFGDGKPIKAQVKTKVVVSNDATGQTISTWSTCRIQPTKRVIGADGLPRPVAAGDRVTVNGVKRVLASAEPVRGPGQAIAYYELVAGDG